MGFEIGGDTVVLEFEEGTALAGAIVRCRMDIPIVQVLQLRDGILSSADSEQAEATYRLFGGEVLSSWDLERDGTPIPATAEGMLSIPIAIGRELLTEWLLTAMGLRGNSSAASTNGSTPKAARLRTPRGPRSRRS